MKDRDKQRLIGLQKQLTIAKQALERIREYERAPHAIAGAALLALEELDYINRPKGEKINA